MPETNVGRSFFVRRGGEEYGDFPENGRCARAVRSSIMVKFRRVSVRRFFEKPTQRAFRTVGYVGSGAVRAVDAADAARGRGRGTDAGFVHKTQSFARL